MNPIVFNSNYTFFQKIILIGGSLLFLNFSYNLLFMTFYDKHDNEFQYPIYIGLIPLFISILLILAFLLRKGIVVENKKLYIGYFIFNKLIYKQNIDLEGITDISIFTKNAVETIEFFRAGPGPSEYSTEMKSIYLLNKRHTVKEFLIESTQNQLIEFTVDLLENEFDLELNSYNPRF
jgi:hypothetical protein